MKQVPKWLIEFALIVAAVLLIRATLVQAFNIPSASMQPTLLIGDFILVNKLVYRLSEPRRGDIVVFRYPVNPNLDYIKRVIAGPGDIVEFRKFYSEEADLWIYTYSINGEEVSLSFLGEKNFRGEEVYEFEERIKVGSENLSYKIWFSPKPFRAWGPIINRAFSFKDCFKVEDEICVKFRVPKGYYFVMGDNRDNSEDSRFWGFVPRENILGKAFVIYFSGKVPPLTPEDVTPFTGFRQLFLALLNPRFERIGKFFIY